MRLYSNNDASNILWEYAFFIVDVDVDIDSNNNNGFDLPDGSVAEGLTEKVIDDPESPGKIMQVDTETPLAPSDNLPGFANFEAIATNTFVPIVINIPSKQEHAFVMVYYYASDPADVEKFYYDYKAKGDESDDEDFDQYIPAKGVMRIWQKKSTEQRSKLSILAGGDFIPSDKKIPLSSLPALVEDKLVLYVETVGHSETAGNYIIQVKIIQP